MDLGAPQLAYFEAEASLYDQRCESILWRGIRAAEYRAIRSLLGEVKGIPLLELGCGSGFYASKLQFLGANVTGVDFSDAMLKQLREKGIEGIHGDVLALRLNRQFPVVLAAGLLEFVADAGAFFEVARAHCSPDGRLILLVPRPGMAGFCYRFWHSLHGVSACIRAPAELLGSASGWCLEKTIKAGPLALALRLKREE